jgi:hypothetical protein
VDYTVYLPVVVVLCIALAVGCDWNRSVFADPGYLSLIGLFSYGLSVASGNMVLTFFALESGKYGLLLVVAVWTVYIAVFYILWRNCAIKACGPDAYPHTMFALQFTANLYSELVFLGVDLRS